MGRENIKSDFKDPNIEQEEIRKKRLKYFVKASTYSETLEENSKDDEEDRGTDMKDKNYYATKASNKTWSQVCMGIKSLLDNKIITNPDIIKECKKFTESAYGKYNIKEVAERPSKMTTSEQMESIKSIINLVIKELLQKGDENITSDIIVENEKLSEELESQTGKIKGATQERIDCIDKTIKFIEKQLKLLEDENPQDAQQCVSTNNIKTRQCLVSTFTNLGEIA
ncbi:MAG: hypothetical protein ABIC82_00420 [bacterium]